MLKKCYSSFQVKDEILWGTLKRFIKNQIIKSLYNFKSFLQGRLT
ncbi:hypothetical protein FORC47_0840 [Bacillus cereus]|nr:hypothetical protein FORC47_0840 [Bacillus cereus]